LHRQQKVEKVGGAEHRYLRRLSLSRGAWRHPIPPHLQEIFEKYCQEIKFGGI